MCDNCSIDQVRKYLQKFFDDAQLLLQSDDPKMIVELCLLCVQCLEVCMSWKSLSSSSSWLILEEPLHTLLYAHSQIVEFSRYFVCYYVFYRKNYVSFVLLKVAESAGDIKSNELFTNFSFT